MDKTDDRSLIWKRVSDEKLRHMRRQYGRLYWLVLFGLLALPMNVKPACAADAPLSTLVAGEGPFELHSAFWINLHHALYQEALPTRGPRRNASAPPLASLSGDEQRAWSAALDHYRKEIVGRDLLFDEHMVAVDSALAAAEDNEHVVGEALGPTLTQVLESAAPIYRRHFWSAQDRSNRFWIAVAVPLVRACGTRMQAQLTEAYGIVWPRRPARVDVVGYANWAGAYTSGSENVHTIVSSSEAGYQGFAALEMLFHEASHAFVGDDTAIGKAITAAARVRHVGADDLWHALLFYTAGELARRDLGELGVKSYEPYGLHTGLWEGRWSDYRSALALYWRAHLDGRLGRDAAITRIVEALAARGP